MDLAKLRSMGLVTSNPLVKREITIKYFPLRPEAEWSVEGMPERASEQVEVEVTVYLRKPTAADLVALSGAKTAEDVAYISIHRSVFTEDGQRLFPTLDDAYGIDLAMFMPLLNEINRLSEGFGRKKSRPRTSSGARSRSPSAVKRSASGKTTCPPKKSGSGSSIESGTAP